VTALDPPFGAADAGGMSARIDGAPAQITAQLERLADFRWSLPARPPALLAVGGMGGSAMAAELCAALWADRLPRPMLVVREYRWPACVGADALALLSSYSGNTEETLALWHEAGARGVPRVAMATGGTLGQWAMRAGAPAAPLPPGSPPRAALYAGWVTVMHLLHALRWIDDDPVTAWRAAAAALAGHVGRWGSAIRESDNAAKQLARALLGRRVFVYAASERTGAVATRLRHQLAENAKVLGHSALVPELDHNEIVGWERPGEEWRDVSLVVLDDREDAPEVTTRLALTAEYAQDRGAAVHRVALPPGERLSRMAGGVLFADYVSLYLALLRGVDPTPIASIDAFKRRLAGRAAAS
jgi:glucose/mannose-6-phosphate isomerase